MSKFTPGPWRKNGGMIYAEVNRKTIAVAEVFDGADDCDLVAAAPDMYEALKGLLAKVECGTALECDLCDAARNALKKAEGKS